MSQVFEIVTYLRQCGHILIYETQKSIIFNSYPILINNKNEKAILNLSVCPIFDLSRFKTDEHHLIDHITFSLTDWEFIDNTFESTEIESGKKVILTTLDNESNKEKFNTWLSELNNLPETALIHYISTEPLDNYFINCWRELHKTS